MADPKKCGHIQSLVDGKEDMGKLIMRGTKWS